MVYHKLFDMVLTVTCYNDQITSTLSILLNRPSTSAHQIFVGVRVCASGHVRLETECSIYPTLSNFRFESFLFVSFIPLLFVVCTLEVL